MAVASKFDMFSLTVQLIGGEQILLCDSSRICSSREEILQYASSLGGSIIDNYHISFCDDTNYNKLIEFITKIHPSGKLEKDEEKNQRIEIYLNDEFLASFQKRTAIKENWENIVGNATYCKAKIKENKFYFSNAYFAQNFIRLLTDIIH